MNEEIVAKFGADTGPIDAALRKLHRGVLDFGNSLKTAFTGIFSGIGASILGGLSLGALTSAAKAITEYGARVQDIAETTGASTDFIQGFSSVVAASGGSAEKAEKGLEKLNVLIGKARDGSEEAMASFQQYGISLIDASGKAKSTDQVMLSVADKMAGVSDSSKRSAMAVEFFGEKIGSALVPALKDGSAELSKLINEAHKLGPGEIKSLDDLSDGLSEMGRVLKVEGGTILGFWSQLATGMSSAKGVAAMMESWLKLDLIKAAASISVGGNQSPISPISKSRDGTPVDYSQFRSSVRELEGLKALDVMLQKISDKQDDMRFKEMSDTQKLVFLEQQKKEMLEKAAAAASPEASLRWAEKRLDVEEKIAEIKRQQFEEQQKAAREEGSAAKSAYDKYQASKKEIGDIGKFTVGALADMARAVMGQGGGGNSGSFGNTVWSSSRARSGPRLTEPMRLALEAESELAATQKAELQGDASGANAHRNRYLDAIRRNPALSSSEKAIIENRDLSKDLLKLFQTQPGANVRFNED